MAIIMFRVRTKLKKLLRKYHMFYIVVEKNSFFLCSKQTFHKSVLMRIRPNVPFLCSITSI